MESVSRLVEALYSRFLLADVFGKMVPGFVVFYSAVMTLWSLPPALERVERMGSWGWPVVFGLSWVLGLGLQSAAHSVRIAHEFRNLGRWYEVRARFERLAQEEEKQQIARLLVIREASGNGCAALIVSLLIPALSTPHRVWLWFQQDLWTRIVLIVMAIAIAVCLWWMAQQHRRRCEMFVNAVLRIAELPNTADGARRAAADP